MKIPGAFSRDFFMCKTAFLPATFDGCNFKSTRLFLSEKSDVVAQYLGMSEVFKTFAGCGFPFLKQKNPRVASGVFR
jgi:hypothetical protein